MLSLPRRLVAAALLLTVQESGCWPSAPGDSLRDLDRVELVVPRRELAVGDSVLVRAQAYGAAGSAYVKRVAAPALTTDGVRLAPVRATALAYVRAVAPGTGWVVATLRDRRDSVAVRVHPAP